MDRWGPSEDCKVCGQPQSLVDLVACPVCEGTMCKWCLEHNYDCHSVCTEDEQGDLE